MTVFTLGYEKRSISEYITILKEAEVDIVVDVRETAWSHKRDFCKKKLSEELASGGINYIHMRQLGNPKRLRKDTSKENVLVKYRNYLEETESGIPELFELIKDAKKKNKNVCLTCFEKAHLECHRSVIINHIKSTINFTAKHL